MDYSSHQVLERLSYQHLRALQLCERIRKDLEDEVPLDQIQRYTRAYWETELEPHFHMEQHCLYPMLGPNNLRIKRAVAKQRRLTRLFNQETNLRKALYQIEEELAAYMRFEAGILRREIEDEIQKLNLVRIRSCQRQMGAQKECLWS